MLDVVDLKSINGMSALGTCQAWVVEKWSLSGCLFHRGASGKL